MQCAVMQIVGVATECMNIDTPLSRLQISSAIARAPTFYEHDSNELTWTDLSDFV